MGLRWAFCTVVAAPALLWRPCGGSAGELAFSGSLQVAGHESICIRLPDQRLINARLPNTSRLAGVAIAARYNIGDQVQISCKPVEPVWDAEAGMYQSLEVTKFRFLRPPTRGERANVLAYRPWRTGVNLLRRPTAGVSPNRSPPDKGKSAAGGTAGGMDAAVQSKLEHAREVNMAYASNLPNFVADETAKRYTSHDSSPQWRYRDTIESEIAFQGGRALRLHIRQNGKPWDRPFQALRGFTWYGGFGTEIEPVFEPECPTAIEYQGPAEVRGQPLLAYRFSSPADGCFGPFTAGYQRYNPARSGHVFVDDPGGHVVQLDEEATAFPAEFGFVQRKEEVSWDNVKIGDASHWLPIRADFVVLYSSGEWWRVEVEYRNHRHFEDTAFRDNRV
jgi:hypothetical protein